jgi:hypothetical protein
VLSSWRIAASSATACLSIGAVLCLVQPRASHAQQATTSANAPSASAAGSSARGHAHPADDARHHDQASQSRDEKLAHEGHRDRDDERTDRNHAEREQQELHETIRQKLVAFDATIRKRMLDKQQEERRLRESRHGRIAAALPPGAAVSDTSHDGTIRERPASFGAGTKPASVGDVRPHASRVAGPSPIPTAVQTVSTDAAKNPHGDRALPTPIGGATLNDPKKGAVLAGATVHHRL